MYVAYKYIHTYIHTYMYIHIPIYLCFIGLAGGSISVGLGQLGPLGLSKILKIQCPSIFTYKVALEKRLRMSASLAVSVFCLASEFPEFLNCQCSSACAM
jgi:hypothetical protein